MIQDAIIKIIGGFLTACGILMTKQEPLSPGWVIFFFTVGLALLFLPKTEK